MSNHVTRLRIDDEDFLVASMIDRCPKVMMLRELFQNALEAAEHGAPGRRIVTLRGVEVDGVRKLAVWNTGPGMNRDELYRICDLASSIRKVKGLDQNFGMGAKVATLASNALGVRYRSCAEGRVHEVTIGKRDGAYGRIWRIAPNSPHGPADTALTDIVDVTSVVLQEGGHVDEDWTEVVLMGMHPSQDTVTEPFGGDPDVSAFWLPEYLYRRFFVIGSDIEVFISDGLHWLDGSQRFGTMTSRTATSFARHEAVQTAKGLRVHYFYDPAHAERTWENGSSEGALQSSASIVGLVYRGELYDVKSGSPWAYEAPRYGITFGARHISVLIELPDDGPVQPDAYRQFIRYKTGAQDQVQTEDFAAIAKDHRPAWLLQLIEAMGTNSRIGDTLRQELSGLMLALGVRIKRPVSDQPVPGVRPPVDWLAPKEDAFGEPQDPFAAATLEPEAPPSEALHAAPEDEEGDAPEIVLLRDEQDIRDRWLQDRAAFYYAATHQLFINTHYPSVLELTTRLEQEGAEWSGRAALKVAARAEAEACMVKRVGRAVVYGLAKRMKPDLWQPSHVDKAMAPESLSIAADDIGELLPQALVHMRAALSLNGAA